MKATRYISWRWLALGASIFLLSLGAGAQTVSDNTTVAMKKPAATATTATAASPAYKSYRNVSIGTSLSEVKSQLGRPENEYPDAAIFKPSKSETVQIMLGKDGKVQTIAVTFDNGQGAPTLEQVFGPGATADKKPDGSVYKMQRYPEAGYWIGYYAGSGDHAAVTLTIQKIGS